MCGILGCIGNIPPKYWPEAHTLLKNIMIESKIRGKDATGFSSIHNLSKPSLLMEKRPISSDKFVDRSSRFKALRRHMPKLFIGHTRLSTSGNPKLNRNNHPFNSTRYSLVHNGGVHEWEKISRELAIDKKMRTGTDSEILLHLLEERDGVPSGVQHMMKSVPIQSRVAIATLEHHPSLDNRLWLFRNLANKVYLLTVPKWRAIFFASTDIILKKALSETYKDNTKSAIESYKIEITELPDWKLVEFGFDGHNPVPMNTYEILRPYETKKTMGFSPTPVVVSPNSSKEEEKISVSPIPESRRLPHTPFDFDLSQENGDETRSLLNTASDATRGDAVNLSLSVQRVSEILRSIRSEPFMQENEIDDFKKWMLRPI